ncbi:MAG TPA: GGDEF domain-containing protein, partial [Candidatus Limnocylindria bacterium]|nr:GGDEF domain-containing protein [Candidatus Limnocylindria bacterium]
MEIELIFIIVTGIIAAMLGLGALVAAIRSARRAGSVVDLDDPDREVAEAYDSDPVRAQEGVDATYGSAVRILWWISIAAVLIGVGLSDAFDASQPGIYLVGGVAVGVVVLLHDVLPNRLRSGTVAVLEVLVAIGLTTLLLTLTGYGGSPFAFGYHLAAVAVALALGSSAGLGVAAVATLAYLGVLAIDPSLPDYQGADLLRFGLSIGAIWLLAYVAGVFASGERRMRATVLQLSRTDTLTSLFNRSQLFPTLEQEVQRTRRSERGFCLLMIDLDGLKAVNDSFGHHRGDEVLRSLGNVIRRSIRSVDTAYRYGGDEFLVLLPETDFAGAFVVAEKIRAGAEAVGLAAGGGDLLTSVSIGLVSCPEDGTSAEELMIAADRAMYQAKSLGKNKVSGNPRPPRLPYRPEPPDGEPEPPLSEVPPIQMPRVGGAAVPGLGRAEQAIEEPP